MVIEFTIPEYIITHGSKWQPRRKKLQALIYFDKIIVNLQESLQLNLIIVHKILGSDLFQRAKNTIQLLQNLGIDIQHIIIPGRGHNNINSIGVNKLGEKFIYDVYKSTIDNLRVSR